MLKVGHIIWNGNIGGIERLVIDLIQEQNRSKDLKVELIVLKKEGPLISRLDALNIKIYFAGIKKVVGIKFNVYLNLYRHLINLDIIHFHGFFPLVFLLAILSKKQIIYTEHGNFGIGRKPTIFYKLNQFLKRILLIKYCKTISFNSKFTKDFALKKYNWTQSSKMQVVYNGISFNKEHRGDVDELSRLKELRLNLQNNIVIGFVGRLAKVKRIEKLLKAFALIENKENCKLLIVGEGPEKNHLKELSIHLGIDKKVIFASYFQETSSIFKMLDISVLPSSNEAFGLVVIEALAHGIPCIVFEDGGGAAELLEKIAPEDIVYKEKDLANRLEYYLNNLDSIKSELKVEQRKSYAAQYNITAMAKQFDKIYRKA